MTFIGAIDRIMHEVTNSSDEPFVIYRDCYGGWHSEYTQNQYGETFEWAEDIKEKDPFARIYKGSDFSKRTFSFVYDNVLIDRLRSELKIAFVSDENLKQLRAITNFFEDNASAFSSDTTNYLMEFDRPLETLYEMCPYDMVCASDDMEYDEHLADDAVESIEKAIRERLNKQKDKPAKENRNNDYAYEKRTIEGYVEISEVAINGRLLFVGENPEAEHRYMVGEYSRDNPLGVMAGVFVGVTDDFLEAIDRFAESVTYNVNVVKSERDVRKNLDGVEPLTLTADECIPNGLNEDLSGKPIVIKPEALAPEYRYADHQLRVCQGGFGANPNSRGNAVFCKELFYGKESRFERIDVLGVADISKLPEWAKIKLEELQNENDNRQNKKPSLLGKLDDNKQKIEREKLENKDRPTKKKSVEPEVT